MKKYRPKLHPNACRKLVRFFRQVKRETGEYNMRETARRLGVNQRWVHGNLIHGTEPTDATESGREARVKIFLKAYKPKPRAAREPKPRPAPLTPEWWDRIRKHAVKAMVKSTNDAVVRRSEHG